MKFGRAHLIIDAQPEILRMANQLRLQSSAGLISFQVFFSNFVDMLKEYDQTADL